MKDKNHEMRRKEALAAIREYMGTARKSRARGPASYACFTIRVLLQVKFLSGPRTQNPTDLAAVDRALV